MAKWRPEKRRNPCKECPFRKNSAPGYLGADYPEHFLEMTMRDADMPCHMDIDYSKKDWLEKQEPDAPLCVGAMQFQNNNMKLSRNPEVAAAQHALGTSPHVFTRPEEFLIHHQTGRHAKPVSSSLWWNGHTVNFALGFTDVGRVEHWQTAEMAKEEDSPGMFVAMNQGGILHAIEHGPEGGSLRAVEWLNDYYQMGGRVVWRVVDPDEYAEAQVVAREDSA
jgi:hypothetical protein